MYGNASRDSWGFGGEELTDVVMRRFHVYTMLPRFVFLYEDTPRVYLLLFLS